MAGLGTLLRLHPITFATIVLTSVIVSVIIHVVIHVFAGLLGGKAGFIEFFRCAAYASIIGWINVIGGLLGGRLGALIGLVIALAHAFVLVIILETVHQLERPKSFVLPGLLLIPAVLGFFTSLAVIKGADMFKDSKYGKIAQQIEKAAPQFEKAGKAFEKMAEQVEKAAEHDPVDPVNFRELMKLIPRKIEGFQGNKPKGSTGSLGGAAFAVSSVERQYLNREEEKRLKISIVDTGYNRAFIMMQLGWWLNMEYDSTEGFLKAVKVDGYDGKMQWETSGSGSLAVNVIDRFYVMITFKGFKDQDSVMEDMLEIAEDINFSGLEKLE